MLICSLETTESDVSWGSWAPWSSCSVTCGGRSGVQNRERECTDEMLENCIGPAAQEMQCFNNDLCEDEDGERFRQDILYCFL